MCYNLIGNIEPNVGHNDTKRREAMFIGLVLVAIGILALLVTLNVLTGSIWSYAWPIILIILGLSFLIGRRHRHGFWRHCCGSAENGDKK
jgi:hypothetical protein